jgi:acetate---CoA ligase (ADP-forming)
MIGSEPHELKALFEPRSVAVVGASTKPNKWGHIIVRNLQRAGFRGDIYPVTPREQPIRGLKSYPTLAAVPDQVDCAVVGIGGDQVPSVVEQAADNGTKVLVVVSSGFAETGPEGREKEERLVELAQRFGIRIVGPNCMGIYSSSSNFYASLGLDPVIPGGIALISQSGNVGVSLFRGGVKLGVGFRAFVGVGNQADLSLYEYLDYFARDDGTNAIAIYAEGLKQGREFFDVARRVSLTKPVLFLKGGETESGMAAALSHTGHLAGDGRVYRGVLRQCGVVQASSLEELQSLAYIFDRTKYLGAQRVGVLTDGGGFGVLVSDLLSSRGTSLATLTEDTTQQLREALPPRCSAVNPVDIGGDSDSDPALLARCAELLMADPEVDAVLLNGIIGGYRNVFSDVYSGIEERGAELMVGLPDRYNKTLIVQSVYAGEDNPVLDRLEEGRVPVVASLTEAVDGLSAMRRLSDHRRRRSDRPTGTRFLSTTPRELLDQSGVRAGVKPTELDLYRFLSACGISVPKAEVVRAPEDAVEVAERIGYPVVAKTSNPELLHKSDVRGVVLNLTNAEQVHATTSKLLEAHSAPVLLAQQVDEGFEVIVGGLQDPTFGPMVMLGVGGTLAELVGSVAWRLPPLDRVVVEDMIDQAGLEPLLAGQRGAPPADRDSLIEIVLRVGECIGGAPEIREMDLNPVKVGPLGSHVVDAKIVLGEVTG